jgi:DNA-binding winged helix-turn-helix (wHTH) protein
VTYRFEEFEVDDREFRLSEGGSPVQVEPKVLRLLVCLIENRNRLILKQELLDKVWSDAAVTENALTRAIGLLRKALREDSREPRFIETVPTAGYRFIANVSVVENAPVGVVVAGRERGPVSLTSGEGARASRRWIAGTLLVVTVGAIGTWLLAARWTRPVLTEEDAVVLADFTNSTGESVFDGTLRQGLAIQLEQSPFLKILDDEPVQRDLRLMNLEPGAHITDQIAHDICVREGAAATIGGAIANLGKAYVITLQAMACQDGVTLARDQVQAEDKEHVLKAVGTAATAMRRKLGESLTSVQRLNRPLEQATTPSLEALQNYDAGLSVMSQGSFLAAVPLFERAAAIDPKFTMTYYMLGIVYEQAGDIPRSAEFAKRAFSTVDHVSANEPPTITGAQANWTKRSMPIS